jgi:UDP-N-acetyl-D-mannosaminuronic acid transferase (WecB/TagA/CpsF family)
VRVANGKAFPEMHWSKSGIGKQVVVTVSGKDALLEDIAGLMESGTGYSVATLNLDHVVKLRHDPAFHAAYSAHSHVTADGNPIVWLSRMSGQDIELVPGSELILPIAVLAAQQGVPVAFFGSTDASLKAAADALEAQVPGLKIALTLAPPMGFDPQGADADAAIEEMRASGARLVPAGSWSAQTGNLCSLRPKPTARGRFSINRGRS